MSSNQRDRSRPGDRSGAAVPRPRHDDYYDSDGGSSYDDDRETITTASRVTERPRFLPPRPAQNAQRREPASFTNYEYSMRRDSTQTGQAQLTGAFGERPPPSSIPPLTSMPPQPSIAPPSHAPTNPGTVPMTGTFRRFLDIPLEGFKKCARFVEDYPKVLDESTNALQQTAKALFARAETEYGDRCVERILMIKVCNDHGVDYLYDLRKNDNRYMKFKRDHKKLKELLNPDAAATDDPPAAPARPKGDPPPPAAASRFEPAKKFAGDQASLIDDTASLNIDTASKFRRQSIAGDVPGSSLGKARLARTQSHSTAVPNMLGQPIYETREPEIKPIGRVSADTIMPLGDTRPRRDTETKPIGRLSADTLKPLGGDPRTRRDPASAINKSSLDKNYWVRRDGRTFFVVGRVFKVLWHQPAGADRDGRINEARHSKGIFGESIYSQLRWMVVIKQKEGYSLCCPISTYSGNGLTRKAFPDAEIRAHAIVFDSKSRPKAAANEPRLPKEAIEVHLTDERSSIDSNSRVHFGKCFTVEWNVKVMDVGMVASRQIDRITAYFLNELKG